MRRKKQQEAWVVKKDEFHPDPQEAAKHADVLSRRAALRQLEGDLEKMTARGPMRGGEIAARQHADNVAHFTREVARLKQEIADAAEEEDDQPEVDEGAGLDDDARKKKIASLSSRISRAKKDGDEEKVRELMAERSILKTMKRDVRISDR